MPGLTFFSTQAGVGGGRGCPPVEERLPDNDDDDDDDVKDNNTSHVQ
jgi:hypothetical protein